MKKRVLPSVGLTSYLIILSLLFPLFTQNQPLWAHNAAVRPASQPEADVPPELAALVSPSLRNPIAGGLRHLVPAYAAYLASCATHRSIARVPIRPK